MLVDEGTIPAVGERGFFAQAHHVRQSLTLANRVDVRGWERTASGLIPRGSRLNEASAAARAGGCEMTAPCRPHPVLHVGPRFIVSPVAALPGSPRRKCGGAPRGGKAAVWNPKYEATSTRQPHPQVAGLIGRMW